MSLKNYYHL